MVGFWLNATRLIAEMIFACPLLDVLIDLNDILLMVLASVIKFIYDKKQL